MKSLVKRIVPNVQRSSAALTLLALLAWSSAQSVPTTTTSSALAECELLFKNKAYTDALQSCKPLAEQEMAPAQYIMGRIYNDGYVVAGNPRTAVQWFLRAANLDYTEGQYYLGRAYLAGRGIGVDVNKAQEWFQKAADKGYVDALFQLGAIYYNRRADYEKGVFYTRQAACKGSVEARKNMITIHSTGIGDLLSCKFAAWWAEKASSQSESARVYYLNVTRDPNCIPDPNYSPCT